MAQALESISIMMGCERKISVSPITSHPSSREIAALIRDQPCYRRYFQHTSVVPYGFPDRQSRLTSDSWSFGMKIRSCLTRAFLALHFFPESKRRTANARVAKRADRRLESTFCRITVENDAIAVTIAKAHGALFFARTYRSPPPRRTIRPAPTRLRVWTL